MTPSRRRASYFERVSKDVSKVKPVAGSMATAFPERSPYRPSFEMLIVPPVPGTTLDVAQVQAFCKTRLASFKVPTVVEIRDELPKTSIGKIAKKLLRDESLAALGTSPT